MILPDLIEPFYRGRLLIAEVMEDEGFYRASHVHVDGKRVLLVGGAWFVSSCAAAYAGRSAGRALIDGRLRS